MIYLIHFYYTKKILDYKKSLSRLLRFNNTHDLTDDDVLVKRNFLAWDLSRKQKFILDNNILSYQDIKQIEKTLASKYLKTKEG